VRTGEQGTGLPWRLGPRATRWFDAVLVGLLLLPTPVMAAESVSWSKVVLTVLELAPLWWRRRCPVPVFAAISAASALQAVITSDPLWGQAGYPIAIYSVARFSTARWSLVALGVGVCGAVVASYRWLTPYGPMPASGYVSYIISIGTIVVTAWALGTLGRIRSAYVATLLERHEQLRRDAAQQAALGAADERARIAREMHDVVAHGLSVIVVQADGARYAADPATATAALATIADTGRDSLAEMRRMLGLLRSDEAETRPQPTLADVDTLVEEARTAGTTIEARLPASAAVVPDGIGLTAYRIVQEALSNVRKHAGPGATATLSLVVDDAVEVEVCDDGRGASASADGRGLGLVGMAERVAIHGGRLEAGPQPGGGFRVWARIPL